MITCPKCNKELSDGTKFCDSCVTQWGKKKGRHWETSS